MCAIVMAWYMDMGYGHPTIVVHALATIIPYFAWYESQPKWICYMYVWMDGCMYACMHACMYLCMYNVCVYIYIYKYTYMFFFSESNFWPWRWEFTGNTQACSQHPEYNGKMAILTANFCPENSPRWFSHLSRSWNKPVPGPKPCNLSPEEDLWDQMIEDRRNPRPPRVLNEISSKLTKNIPSVRVDLPTNQISPYVYIYISVTHLI